MSECPSGNVGVGAPRAVVGREGKPELPGRGGRASPALAVVALCGLLFSFPLFLICWNFSAGTAAYMDGSNVDLR